MKVEYSLRIPYPADHKIGAILAVMIATGRGLKEAHQLVNLGIVEESGERDLSEVEISKLLKDMAILRRNVENSDLDIDLDIKLPWLRLFNRGG
jgi:hypothetical protein